MKALLLGDLCHHSRNKEYFVNQNMEVLFADTLKMFEGNDICFVNLECAITDSENAIKKYGPNLKVVRETADVMKKLGVTLCGLSNNHIFDYGKDGVADTIRALENVGIPYTGFGNNYEDSRRNYILNQNGEKIAFVAVCEHEYSYALDDRMGSRPFDPFHTMADIRKAKSESDRVIVLYHGGKEHCQYPSPRLVNACREMANNGADVILCQHTHCIGCYENYNGCHILYGQGNFHFLALDDMPDMWNYSLMVKYDTLKNEIEFIPTANTKHGIELAKGELKDRLMREFAQRNASLADGTWKDGWHKFCVENTQRYTDAVKDNEGEDGERGNTLFAHYLDCEAHTDVWRELFKTANHRNEK